MVRAYGSQFLPSSFNNGLKSVVTVSAEPTALKYHLVLKLTTIVGTQTEGIRPINPTTFPILTISFQAN